MRSRITRLGNNLRAALDERRLSHADLAQLTEIPYPVIQRLLRADSNPYLDQAMRIARVLDLSLEQLFWVDDGRNGRR